LQAVYKYNYRDNLFDHDSVQRIYALNDEAAILICDYGKDARPKIPFPYYAEAWTGIEYLVAAQFIHAGMLREGLQTVEDVRKRFDGERRNPWDEPECGHHYARAMSAWSSVVALSGFHYHGADKAITLMPRIPASRFASFWSSGAGWGSFSITRENGRGRTELNVTEGTLPLKSILLGQPSGEATSVVLDQKECSHQVKTDEGGTILTLDEAVEVPAGGKLLIRL
jgi:non-lysosomal glucosylceramidase